MNQISGTAAKKPVVIHWFEWRGLSTPNYNELTAWIKSFGDNFEEVITLDGGGNLRVLTLEGISYALPDGYIIIRGIEGEFYPCEPGIFAKTYEVVSTGATIIRG